MFVRKNHIKAVVFLLLILRVDDVVMSIGVLIQLIKIN